MEEKEEDGRRDTDADWGKKVYCSGVREDGTAWEKVKSWFGYKLHLVVDAKYELPVSYCVTKASAAEVLKAHELFCFKWHWGGSRKSRRIICAVLSGLLEVIFRSFNIIILLRTGGKMRLLGLGFVKIGIFLTEESIVSWYKKA